MQLNRHHYLRPSLALVLIALGAPGAAAQSKAFITGTAFADIKQFDSVAYDRRELSAADPLSGDATGAGGGLRVGTFLHPRWSLELGVDAGSTTKQVFPNPYASFPRVMPALRVPDLSASTRFLSVSTVVGFHPPKIGRARLGYLAGFSFVRATHESELPEIAYAIGSIASGSTTLPSFTEIFSRPTGTTRLKRIDNAPGALLGFEAAIDLTAKLAVVPEIRAITLSTGGRTVFLIRPGVGVRWSF